MMTHDAMQVCLNGHHITDYYHKYSEYREEFCSNCGAETIHTCPDCGTEIEGADPDSALVMSPKDVPDYCEGCGKPYPWTDPADPGELDIDLPNDFFDQELMERSFHHFDDGDYQDAIQNAFIVLEERIRDEAGISQGVVGNDLCQEAFAPHDGPLATGETGGEQAGVRDLFKGMFLAFRNASHHRFINEDHLDQERAYSLLCTINMLLRMTEEAGE